jgi:hypothetical protein
MLLILAIIFGALALAAGSIGVLGFLGLIGLTLIVRRLVGFAFALLSIAFVVFFILWIL